MIILRNVLLLHIFLLLGVQLLYAKGLKYSRFNIETDWSATFQAGSTVLIGELNKDFSGWTNDFNNVADWGVNFQLSKMVIPRLDVGLEMAFSRYRGFKKDSESVNYLMYHYYLNNSTTNFEPYPVYYRSSLNNYTLFFKYNFLNIRTMRKGYVVWNMYAKFGLGVGIPRVVMGYSNPEHHVLTGLPNPLYAKGFKPYASDLHGFFSPAFGINHQFSEHLFFSGEVSFQLIGADNIDGVHNYSPSLQFETDNNLVENHRVRVHDTTLRFLLGVTYYFNIDIVKTPRELSIPWYREQYMTYFSKYHVASSKKERQERLPFFREKFNEIEKDK